MNVDFSLPCEFCVAGAHDQCVSVYCGCIADHADDDRMMKGFKLLKRQMHPEREVEVKGGWRRPPIRVTAVVGEPKEPEWRFVGADLRPGDYVEWRVGGRDG